MEKRQKMRGAGDGGFLPNLIYISIFKDSFWAFEIGRNTEARDQTY